MSNFSDSDNDERPLFEKANYDNIMEGTPKFKIQIITENSY
jgi:hypothetical protein